ncbi:MAG TPA: CHAT domain-containing protein [Thermoanaerobaculia bacterium]|nr:CHAT domain-containing protein [Thermoanaerobaculia bacterium]
MAVILLFTWPLLQRCTDAYRLDIAMLRVRRLADDPGRFPGRLTAPAGALPLRWLASGDVGRAQASVVLLRLAKTARGDTALRASGTAHYLTADYARSAAEFSAIHRRSADDWSDLAAAELCAAIRGHEPERLVAALAAADAALGVVPTKREALFNRSAAITALGVAPAAESSRRVAVSADASPWSALLRRVDVVQPRDDRRIWMEALGRPNLTRNDLVRLTVASPEIARRFTEGVFLAGWAEAYRSGDTATALRYLQWARIVSGALQKETGESLPFDSVVAIERATPQRLQELARGHLAYRDGRKAYKARKVAEAEAMLRKAEEALAAGGSPMAALAGCYAASCVFDRDRPAAALQELSKLLVPEVAARHYALTAQLQYQISLCKAIQGHWSEAVHAATAARALYVRVGERESAAAADGVLSEAYDFLGQSPLAWRYGLAALRDASAVADFGLVRTILGLLCRIEIRGGRWRNARALTRVEQNVLRVAPDGAMDAELFRRSAIVEWRCGRGNEAAGFLLRARNAAQSSEDAELRGRLIAEVDAASGVIVRATDARSSVRLLTSAITFQEQAMRPILLPELLLERGRAYLLLADLSAADRDFDRGIAELEHQRRRVAEPELRNGIFSDAGELFMEAIALQLRLHRGAAAVLSYVERGRARTTLEQIGGGVERMAGVPDVAAIQRHLGERSALVEYVALHDSLNTIVIRRQSIVLRTTPITREALASAATQWTISGENSRDRSGALLYDALIASIAADLEGISAVNIVADDILERVPFAALRRGISDSYLIEKYAVAMVPSASVFVTTCNRWRVWRRPRSIVAFGNPEIARDAYPTLVNLAGAEEEAATVVGPYRQRTLLLGPAATSIAFLTAAPRYDVVHFAGHAIVQRQDPARSALILSPTKGSTGAVTLKEISGMPFHSTQVVVLSACSTREGANGAIEGVESLTRGFLIAGVPAVVGTLWDIDDRDAAPLLVAFHEGLAAGREPAEALQAAQRAAIRSGTAPAAWAAFALTGRASDFVANPARPDFGGHEPIAPLRNDR